MTRQALLFAIAATVSASSAWKPHYTNLGVFDSDTMETSLFWWTGPGEHSKKLVLLESIGCGHYDKDGVWHGYYGDAGRWFPEYEDHSYFRLRELESGKVITNISTSIGFGFGNAFVDYDNNVAWVFGTKYDRCHHLSPSNETTGVWSWKSTDLVNWERVKTDVFWNDTQNFNVDVARVYPRPDGAQWPQAASLPAHRYVMVTNTGNLMVNNAAHGDLTTGWLTLPKQNNWFGCPSIRYLPSDGYYYVIQGGNKVSIARSRTLWQGDDAVNCKNSDDNCPFIQPSLADGQVAPYANFAANAERAGALPMLRNLSAWDWDSNDADVCCESWGGAAEVTSSYVVWGVSSQGRAPQGNLTGPTSYQGIGVANFTLDRLLQSYFPDQDNEMRWV